MVTGLRKLQHVEVHGSLDHIVAEEKPGLLNKVLEGLTSLHLRALSMQCSDIASPNLCYLTVIKLDSGRLPGANPFIHTPGEAQPDGTGHDRGSV